MRILHCIVALPFYGSKRSFLQRSPPTTEDEQLLTYRVFSGNLELTGCQRRLALAPHRLHILTPPFGSAVLRFVQRRLPLLVPSVVDHR